MDFLDALNWRYAVKQFSDKKVPKADVIELLDAARLSASSYGLQPYKIIVIESDSVRQELLPFSFGQDKIAHSSHLIVFAAQTDIGDNTVDKYINQHAAINNVAIESLDRYSAHMKQALAAKSAEEKQAWAHQQAYIALGNFLTCAALKKIDTCPMTGVNTAGYDQVLDLTKQNLTTSVICPIGFRAEDDDQANRPKVRFDFDDVVMAI